MAVDVKIKQKTLFKKKVTIEEIIKLTGLSYGVCDEAYRLIPKEIGHRTILYDENNLARGIEVSLENNDIILRLSLPTTSNEIRCFYDVIEKICKNLNTNTYIRNEEQVQIANNDNFIKDDEEGSMYGLKDIKDILASKEYSYMQIFGVYHPISIGMKEIKEIDNNLENFENLLNKLQQLDLYYAAPKLYQTPDKLIAVYAIGTEISSVVPLKPEIISNKSKDIKDWFVFLPGNKTIKYEDFINNVDQDNYYDANHIIVCLKEEKIKDLITKYEIKI